MTSTSILTAFSTCRSRFEERHAGLACRHGFYKNCSVLKLQKNSWTNHPMNQVQDTTGIFFSIWAEDKAADQSRANYNIHALQLRSLKGHTIASRNFAEDFRQGFEPMRAAWPNVSVDYGPLTLMQGWIEIVPSRFEQDVLVLLERFQHLTPLIDRLLEARRR